MYEYVTAHPPHGGLRMIQGLLYCKFDVDQFFILPFLCYGPYLSRGREVNVWGGGQPSQTT